MPTFDENIEQYPGGLQRAYVRSHKNNRDIHNLQNLVVCIS